MICTNCGNIIAEEMGSCPFCGCVQNSRSKKVIDSVDNSVLLSNDTGEKEFTLEDVLFHQEKNKRKGLIVLLALWVSLNFLCMFLDGYDSGYADRFFPFDGDIRYYDFTEFLFYAVLVPLIVYAIKIFRKNQQYNQILKKLSFKVKYKVLLNHILSGRTDTRIFVCSDRYIKAGVSLNGTSVFYHIGKLSGNSVSIRYEIINHPLFPNRTIRKIFPADMDQNQMLEELSSEIAKFTKSIIDKQK